ncbi:MAG TPA: isochorismatase family cysteine hydrolase [Burkholderiales bacterium]|nr:isochorismatase family cysteine hydrolase [Burkholderiales bacterium]
MPPSRSRDLHGSAPDTCPVALLLIDWINDLEFDSGARLLPQALAAARATAELRKRAQACAVPVIYCNDNFGRWRSDFRALLDHVLRDGVRGQPIAELLAPEENEYFVLKPKHSAFHSTTLDVLLLHLGARTLILTGIAGNFCVLFTAQEAYMRDYRLLVPRDCLASEEERDNRHALEHMAKTCRAEIGPSSGIDFWRLKKAA